MKSNQSVGEGIYNVGFDYSMQTYGIDKEFAIEMPVVTPDNSISYMDMLKPAAPVKPELTVDKKVTKVYNKITYLPAKNTVKLMKDATYVYSKGAATIKVGGNTFVVAPGKTTMKVNGEEVKLKALDGKIVNGRFYVSVEVIEQLGYNVVLK
jgi:hypothetical protein